MFLSKWPRYTLALSLFFAMATAHTAVAEDIIITADSARFHQHEGWGLYEGNAELEQGERKMKARTIKLFVNKDGELVRVEADRKSTRLNSSHVSISYAVFCLK